MFDNICKFLAENFQQDLTSWLLGTAVKLTELKPTELSSEPIRADSLILLQSENLILHTEFQTGPDGQIPFRMLDYRVRVYRRFPQKEMRQIVVYLRPNNSELVQQNSFRLSKTYHEFEVIRMWEQPTETFLKFEGLLPFAVLSQSTDPELTLAQVGETIAKINNKQTQANLAAASAILAGLVLPENMIKRLLRSDIMQESVIYQEIYGEGKEKGKLEGKLEEKLDISLSMLKKGISINDIAEITGLSVELIQKLANNK